MTTFAPEKHHQLDPVFKQLLEDKLIPLKAGVQTEVEVSRLPLAIDAIITVDSEEAHQHLQTETPFFYFLRCNQVEFKGPEDPLTIRDYHRIHGRTHLYLSEHDVEPNTMTVTIICANKPRNVLAYKQIRDRFRRLQPGYYRSANRPQIYLIVIRELPPTPQNYLLLLFTGDAGQFRTALEQMLAEGKINYLPYAWRARPEITQEVLNMKRRDGKMTYQESLQHLVDDFGDDILKIIPAEKRLAGLDPAQRLAGLDPAQRLAGLTPEQILASLAQKQLLTDFTTEYLTSHLSLEERKVVLEQLLQSLMAAIPDQKAEQATPA